MSDTKYNGWTNYETWNVKLWIDNDEGSYNYWREIAFEVWNESEPESWQTKNEAFTYELSKRLKDEFEEGMPEIQGTYADLLSAALSSVNWYEIAESYLEDVAEQETEEIEEAL